MLARLLLGIMSRIYSPIIRIRNYYYDKIFLPHWLDAPVISVGNLTVGGTGKTPMTVWLCGKMLQRGRKPAVLARGYTTTREGMPDEIMMIARRYPEAVVIANPNRSAAGQLAVEEYQAKAVILDDGFQHRRVGRDLDILMIDATLPFGFGRGLPRGLLREPLCGLRRADAVVLTRCDQCEAEEIDEIERRIRRMHPEVPIVQTTHRFAGFTDLGGHSVEAPQSGKVGAMASIARPGAFVQTLEDLGLQPAETRFWPDHHHYTKEDAEQIRQWIRQAHLDALVTTEKDAVKLDLLEEDWPVPVLTCTVGIEMLGNGDTILTQLIDNMLLEHQEEMQLPKDHEESHEPGTSPEETGSE